MGSKEFCNLSILLHVFRTVCRYVWCGRRDHYNSADVGHGCAPSCSNSHLVGDDLFYGVTISQFICRLQLDSLGLCGRMCDNRFLGIFNGTVYHEEREAITNRRQCQLRKKLFYCILHWMRDSAFCTLHDDAVRIQYCDLRSDLRNSGGWTV